MIALDNRGHGQSSKALRPGRLPHRQHGRRTCAHCSIISSSAAPTSWGIRWARASPPSSRSITPARVRSAILGGLGIQLVEGVGLPENIAEALEAPSLADVSDPTGRAVPQPLPSRPDPICGRLPPASAARGRLDSRQVAEIKSRLWLRSAPTTTWRAPRRNWPRSSRMRSALDIPGRDHMLAVGDKEFKSAVLDFLNQRP